MKELKYIKLFEDEEVWVRMTPRQLTQKIEEIFALNDFDKITEEFRKIKDKHSYVQHPPWRAIWDAAMEKWAEMGKNKVEAAPEVNQGDPKQPLRDYLNSIGFNFPFVETIISDDPIPANDMNKITKTSEKLLDAKNVLAQIEKFQQYLKANPPDPKSKTKPEVPKFTSQITPDNFINGATIIDLLMLYHQKELNTMNFMGLFWVGPYADLFTVWSVATQERDDADDETVIGRYININKKLKNLFFDEKHSGPRTDLEKNIDKFGLFFKHRSEVKPEFKISQEDLDQLQKDPQPVIDGIFSIGDFSKVTMVLRKIKPEILKLPNGVEIWKTIIDKWHTQFAKEIEYSESGEQDTE